MYYGELINEVRELQKKVRDIYVYGAGLRGKEIANILNKNNIDVRGYIVTKAEENKIIQGLPVFQADTKIDNDDVGIIIGLGDIYTKEVVKYLKEKRINFDRVVDGGKYISKDRGSSELQDNPTLEITTVIGCKVNCRYCPQDKLLNRYFENNKKRKHILSVSDFEIFLENTPDNCDIMFAGMAEPFLNKDCRNMLEMACAKGRNVSLCTTLEGATDDDIEGILQLPLQFVGLHVADEKKNACISITEGYYGRVERLINAKKKDGTPFVNDISAQANPLPKIQEICKDKYEVLVSLQDRAGNLEGNELASREHMITKEKITCCFSGPQFNNHVVLPDGTLLLCNMDYGMQHVLGNLLEKNFDDIRREKNMKDIFCGIEGDQKVELLCRKCLFAMVRR